MNKSRGIVPASMPHMILASTAIDQLRENPSHARETCLRFLPTGTFKLVKQDKVSCLTAVSVNIDAVLFHTTPEDRILLQQQKTHFNPLLRWIKKSFGVTLMSTSTIGGRIAHPPEQVQRVQHLVHSLVRSPMLCLAVAVHTPVCPYADAA